MQYVLEDLNVSLIFFVVFLVIDLIIFALDRGVNTQNQPCLLSSIILVSLDLFGVFFGFGLWLVAELRFRVCGWLDDIT